MMFDFTPTSKLLGDCTMWYNVSCQGATVNDLINFALSRSEWGDVRVIPNGESWFNAVAKLEYSYGRITKGNIPDDIRAKDVVKIEANGGWGSMDYYVYVELKEG